MITYLAENTEDGIEFTHGFDAESFDEAEKIASKHGWLIICALADEEDVYELRMDPVTIN